MNKTVKFTVASFLSFTFNLIVVDANASLHYTGVHPKREVALSSYAYRTLKIRRMTLTHVSPIIENSLRFTLIFPFTKIRETRKRHPATRRQV